MLREQVLGPLVMGSVLAASLGYALSPLVLDVPYLTSVRWVFVGAFLVGTGASLSSLRIKSLQMGPEGIRREVRFGRSVSAHWNEVVRIEVASPPFLLVSRIGGRFPRFFVLRGRHDRILALLNPPTSIGRIRCRTDTIP